MHQISTMLILLQIEIEDLDFFVIYTEKEPLKRPKAIQLQMLLQARFN